MSDDREQERHSHADVGEPAGRQADDWRLRIGTRTQAASLAGRFGLLDD